MGVCHLTSEALAKSALKFPTYPVSGSCHPGWKLFHKATQQVSSANMWLSQWNQRWKTQTSLLSAFLFPLHTWKPFPWPLNLQSIANAPLPRKLMNALQRCWVQETSSCKTEIKTSVLRAKCEIRKGRGQERLPCMLLELENFGAKNEMFKWTQHKDQHDSHFRNKTKQRTQKTKHQC